MSSLVHSLDKDGRPPSHGELFGKRFTPETGEDLLIPIYLSRLNGMSFCVRTALCNKENSVLEPI